MRKGVSPLTATILLIIFLFIIVFVIRGYIKYSIIEEGTPKVIEDTCRENPDSISFGNSCNEVWYLDLNEDVKLERFEDELRDIKNYQKQDGNKLTCEKTNEENIITCEPKMIDYNINITLSKVTYAGTTIDCCLVEDERNFEKTPSGFPEYAPKCSLKISKERFDLSECGFFTDNVCKMRCYV